MSPGLALHAGETPGRSDLRLRGSRGPQGGQVRAPGPVLAALLWAGTRGHSGAGAHSQPMSQRCA
eukprot:870152-Pyramimonas_sp.AAC.1